MNKYRDPGDIAKVIERVKQLPAEEKVDYETLFHAIQMLRDFRHWTIADVVERHFGLK